MSHLIVTKTLPLTILASGAGSFPTINFFREKGGNAFPRVANPGDPLTLEWSVTGATTITFSSPPTPGGNNFTSQTVNANDSITVNPISSVDYFLLAYGDGESSVEAGVAISIEQGIAAPTWDGTTMMTLPDGSQGPDFGYQYDIHTLSNGNYEDVNIWSQGRLPTNSDRVLIQAGHLVTINSRDAALAGILDVQGNLLFNPTVNTRLSIIHGIVRANGTIQMGNVTAPKQADVSMSLVLLPPASFHPNDINHLLGGLIVLGTFEAFSAETRVPFVRLQLPAKAGDRTLTLSSTPTNWGQRDRIILPDSRHIDTSQPGFQPWHEACEIAAVNGNVVTLARPLTYSHDGAYNPDGTITTFIDPQTKQTTNLFPHAINLIAGVIGVRSSDPYHPNRGYVWMGGSSLELNANGVAWHGLGRVQVPFTPSPTVTGAGTPRGAVQIRSAPAGCRMVACSCFEVANFAEPLPLASNVNWGFLLWNCNNILLKDCASFNWKGSCISVWGNQDGSSCATIDTCAGFYSTGSGGRDTDGIAGNGIWLEMPTNHVIHNIAGGGYSTYGMNIVLGAPSSGTYTISGNYNGGLGAAVVEFNDNESYGGAVGYANWYLGFTTTDAYYYSATNTPLPSNKPSIINDLRIWHTGNWGMFCYESAYTTYNNLIIRGDKNSTVQMQGYYPSDYPQCQTTWNNLDIKGCWQGFVTSGHSTLFNTINNANMQNNQNFCLAAPWGVGAWPDQHDRSWVINNMSSSLLDDKSGHIAISNILDNQNSGNMVCLNSLVLNNWQGSGVNYRCYAVQQAPDFIMPQTGQANPSTSQPLACPASGMTNAQSYITYNTDQSLKTNGSLTDPSGCAIFGAVSPPNAVIMPNSTNTTWAVI